MKEIRAFIQPHKLGRVTMSLLEIHGFPGIISYVLFIYYRIIPKAIMLILYINKSGAIALKNV